ncbi:MAG: hypothetical protein ACYCV5_13050 [Acidimicrobiales bacterium]
MSTATMIRVDFSVEERDRGRLQHLADVFGGGSRSAFLRLALDVMGRLDVAERLRQLQTYGAERLVQSGSTIDGGWRPRSGVNAAGASSGC